MATASNVTTGKPKVSGAIYRAPKGTQLPADAVTPLSDAFISLGYIGEDGIVNANTRTSENFKAWGGDTVLTNQTDYVDTYQWKFLETLNKDVLQTVFGANNVTGASLTSGLTVAANAKELDEYVWVIDMNLRGNVANRIVIPDGKISEMGEITYSDAEVVAYDVTVTAFPDSLGNTHYEYKKQTVA